MTLADDSGIEIEAMGGEPGVRSARFLGEDASYAERFAEIERRLAGLPREQRLARFVCVIAIADPRTGAVRTAEGEVRGLIAETPAGEGGFGYDPIFWVPQHSATMAELPEHEKDIISHRQGPSPARARSCKNYCMSTNGEGTRSKAYGVTAERRPRTRFGRPLHDLRISVTDRCNFRCTYCMPKEVFGREYEFLAGARS